MLFSWTHTNTQLYVDFFRLQPHVMENCKGVDGIWVTCVCFLFPTMITMYRNCHGTTAALEIQVSQTWHDSYVMLLNISSLLKGYSRTFYTGLHFWLLWSHSYGQRTFSAYLAVRGFTVWLWMLMLMKVNGNSSNYQIPVKHSTAHPKQV